MARGSAASAATREPGAFTSPKVIAPVGQASMQAGTTTPSAKWSLAFPSRVAALAVDPRAMRLLDALGVKPSISYLAKVRNDKA